MFETQIAKGVKWARTNHGQNWADKIDLSRFNIVWPQFCVLGQLTGDYYTYMDLGLTYDDTVSMGFTVDVIWCDDQDRAWEKLQAEWTEVIKSNQTVKRIHELLTPVWEA